MARAGLLAAAALCAASASTAAPPKVILQVIVDDLGWGDVAWHRTGPNAENPTPHMAQLVKEGVELNRHYVHKMCTPSRSAYLSGERRRRVLGRASCAAVGVGGASWAPRGCGLDATFQPL